MCAFEPTRSWFAIAAVALGLMTSACEGPPDESHLPAPGPGIEATGAVFDADDVPLIDFDPRPSFLPENTIVLTFDDGPDSTNTARVLDILRSKNVRATFFINSQNYTDIETDPNAQAVVRRIVDEGHELGNHTAGHLNLSTLSEDAIEDEITRVEDAVRDIVSPSRRLTLLRAPFGIPYDPNGDTSGFDKVAPIVAEHAVHIGWSITPQDFACGDASCVFEGVRDALDDGDYGIVLLHSPLSQTVGALPDLIDFARANGYTFRLTEDVVRARFGQSSGEMISRAGAQRRDPTAR